MASGGIFGKKIEPVKAVVNFNISVHAGEVVGIIGSSGSGKTTAARLLTGLGKA